MWINISTFRRKKLKTGLTDKEDNKTKEFDSVDLYRVVLTPRFFVLTSCLVLTLFGIPPLLLLLHILTNYEGCMSCDLPLYKTVTGITIKMNHHQSEQQKKKNIKSIKRTTGFRFFFSLFHFFTFFQISLLVAL